MWSAPTCCPEAPCCPWVLGMERHCCMDSNAVLLCGAVRSVQFRASLQFIHHFVIKKSPTPDCFSHVCYVGAVSTLFTLLPSLHLWGYPYLFPSFFLAFLHDSLTIVTCKFATQSLLHDFSWFHVGLQPSWCDGNFQYDLVNDFCHTGTEVLNVEFNFLFFLADLIGYFVKDADLCTEQYQCTTWPRIWCFLRMLHVSAFVDGASGLLLPVHVVRAGYPAYEFYLLCYWYRCSVFLTPEEVGITGPLQ